MSGLVLRPGPGAARVAVGPSGCGEERVVAGQVVLRAGGLGPVGGPVEAGLLTLVRADPLPNRTIMTTTAGSSPKAQAMPAPSCWSASRTTPSRVTALYQSGAMTVVRLHEDEPEEGVRHHRRQVDDHQQGGVTRRRPGSTPTSTQKSR